MRGIYWFSIACLVVLPPAIDRALGSREPPHLAAVSRVVSLLAVLGLVIAAIAVAWAQLVLLMSEAPQHGANHKGIGR